MKKVLMSLLVLTLLIFNFTGCTRIKNNAANNTSKITSGAKSEASKVESKVESKASEIKSDASENIEEHDGGLVEDENNSVDNDELPEVSSNK